AVTGIDLVQAQIRVAGGATLAELNLTQAQIPEPRGFAVQLRINLETMHADGSAQPAAGIISAYEPPSGPGIRVDGYGYAGYATSSSYDSLLAKLIVHADSDFAGVLKRTYRALCEFRLEGVASNLHFLQNLLRQPQLADNAVNTRFIESHIDALLAPQQQVHPHLYFAQATGDNTLQRQHADIPAGCIALNAPNAGVLVSVDVAVGDAVAVGQTVAIL